MTIAGLLHGHTAPNAACIWERTADALAALRVAQATQEGGALGAQFSGDAQLAGDAAVIRYSECDPINVPTCLTSDAITVPIALALARDGAHYLRSVAGGTAVGLRLARAVGGVEALNKGVWPSLFAAPAVAAVTAARARGAEERVVAAALALALGGVSGRAGRPDGFPSGRWILFGEAVLKGLRAVDAALAGATGDPDLANGEWLAAQATPGTMDASALSGSGQSQDSMGLKPYVAARQGMTAIAAFQDLLAQGIDPATIKTIEVALPSTCLDVVCRPVNAGNRLSAVANLPLALGLVAYAPQMLLNIARDGPVPQSAKDLARRVMVTGDPTLDRGAEGIWPAVLTVSSERGKFTHRRDLMPGDPADPGREAMLRAKLKVFGATDLLRALEEAAHISPDAALAG